MISEIDGLAAYIQIGGLEKDWSLALGVDIQAEIALGPISVDLLSQGELARYRRLEDPLRRRSWLTGRAALKRLLCRLDLGSDTAKINFPSAGFSLSHANDAAIAVACDQCGRTADSCLPLGLGVDIEADRPIRHEMARFFLSKKEQECLAQLEDLNSNALLRIWTIKEAVFKSDLENHNRMLSDYHLMNISARKGIARLHGVSAGPVEFRYISKHLAGWHISVATRRESKHGQG